MHEIGKDPRYAQAVQDIKTYIVGVYDSTSEHHDKQPLAQALSSERYKMMEAAALRIGETAMREYARIRRGFVEAAWKRKRRATKGAKKTKRGKRLSHPKH